jgi:hypothetical protein
MPPDFDATTKVGNSARATELEPNARRNDVDATELEPNARRNDVDDPKNRRSFGPARRAGSGAGRAR